MYEWNDASDFPSVITIFSAPNYCDIYGNKGALIKIEVNLFLSINIIYKHIIKFTRIMR